MEKIMAGTILSIDEGDNMQENIMVSIICLTYNHELFIEDALKGFLNQNTNFKYEVLIHDDASTDKTAELIREYEEKYPNIVKPVYQINNQYNKCRIFPTYLLPKVKGKYIALCDGDDYWIDKNKLQLQIDYMESHESCTLTLHNAWRELWQTGGRHRLDIFPASGCYEQKLQILSGLGTDYPASASMIFRSDVMKKIPKFFLEPKAIDYTIRQYCASLGEVYYFDRIMSVYRVATPQSFMKKATESISFYCQYTMEMIRFFEQFDEYTEYKFHQILQRKISSDYYGYCCSVNEEKGLEYADDLDKEKIKKYYEYLSDEYLSDEIKMFIGQAEIRYIYGTSRLAAICGKQLTYHGIAFEGYVVSDNQIKSESFQGKPVYYLSQLQDSPARTGFILGVQPVNTQAIITELKKTNYTIYCEPYPV